MNNKCLSKLLKFSVILLCLFMMMSNLVAFGYDVAGQFSGNISANANEGKTMIATVLSTVLDVVRLVGAGAALIILMYIGVKFMIASPSERASIKQYSINYVIGAVILMGASGFLTIVKNVANNVIQL